MAKKWNYDENTDYQDLINKAVAGGDYSAAARYEQQRNAKISDLDASGGNKWGATATNNYSQYLMPEGYGGSSLGVGVNNQNQAAIREQMNANSLAWWEADEAGRAQLEAANQALGAQLGGSVSFDPTTGYWGGVAENVQQPQSGGFTFDVAHPTFQSPYGDRIDAMLDQILNREDFSYTAADDPIFQQYAAMYSREGDRARSDTLAEMASGAGGMNSYALTAAQQAQNYYGAQMADKVPELYQLAYQMYLQDIDNQVRDLGLLQDMDNTQYGRYRDTMSDWRNDRDFAYGMYRDDIGDQRWETEWNYGVGQTGQENARAEVDAILAAGGTPSKDLISASGYSPEYIAALQAMYAPQMGGYGGYVPPEEVTPEDVPDRKVYNISGIGTVDAETALEMEEDGVIVITGTDKYGAPVFAPTGKYTDKRYPTRT